MPTYETRILGRAVRFDATPGEPVRVWLECDTDDDKKAWCKDKHRSDWYTDLLIAAIEGNVTRVD